MQEVAVWQGSKLNCTSRYLLDPSCSTRRTIQECWILIHVVNGCPFSCLLALTACNQFCEVLYLGPLQLVAIPELLTVLIQAVLESVYGWHCNEWISSSGYP